ncbi:MAG: BMP family ABC transporter substrate-binding protein [Gammaproteobacteria bacterium]
MKCFNFLRAVRCGVKAAAACVGAAALLGGVSAFAADLKVGFVYVGPIGDHGWSYQHNQGRLALEQALGDKVETTFVESVPEGADAERVIRQLASSGHNLIFTTSFGYMEPTIKVARQFPNVRFEHATGYKRAENVSTYNARFYEGRYVAGVIAGRMSKTGIIGYIASHPIPEVIRGINSFALGLRSVNPDAAVKVVWVNSWYDPGKESDAAKSLLDQGADILLQHTDSPAPLQAAEHRGALGFGQASDMRAFGENAQLSAIVNNWSGYYIARAKAVLDGSWESADTWDGLAADMVKMADYSNMPEDVAAQARATEEKIRGEALHPFAGPIKDQSGAVRVPAGQIADMLSMDWYVEGVEGNLP